MQVSRHFELLNYSEHGTEVNGQLFSCDLTEHNDDDSDVTDTSQKQILEVAGLLNRTGKEVNCDKQKW